MSEELWSRHARFLKELLPVAEAAGVRLALHPDDPPLEYVRQQPRLVHRHHLAQRVIDLDTSPSNQLDFCVGTFAEMQDDTLYECLASCSRQRRVAYVHLRNVHGKAPNYCETFIDDGDIDIAKVVQVLRRTGFDGVIIPDHAPQMSCAAPWHAGMAYAMGYIKAQLQGLGRVT